MNANDLPVSEQIRQEARANLRRQFAESRTAWEQDCKALREILKRHNVTSVVSEIAEICREQSEVAPAKYCGETAPQYCADMELAADILDITAAATDLAYGNQYTNHRKIRREVVAEFKARAEKVTP